MHTIARRSRPVIDAAIQHARLVRRIAAFVDGELSRGQMRAVQGHLAHCIRCRRELALQKSLAEALGRESVPAASALLRRRIEWMGEPPIQRREPPHQRPARPPRTKGG
jgi:anti-sigma factor RsiW